MAEKKKSVSQSFAKDFEQLERIVARFEEEETVDLDKSVKEFEKGLQLAEKLKKMLDGVENSIQTLKSKYDMDE